MNNIRTRFAPSPTGWMHIGNLRTALYAYLFAKANNGTFILRIEDTDVKRLVPGAKEFIFKVLKEAGLDWDEGPDIGGDFGPYIQSERRDIYLKYAKKLVELDGGYYCFCDEKRELEAGKLDLCRDLDIKKAKKRIEEGEEFVVRQRIPQKGEITYYDLVYGKITFPNKDLDEGVMLKRDGLPTYNFANVIDDHLMKISHIMRGNEYLSSTPKYELLYNTFGWKSPKYVHLTQIMKDAHQKLSKRHGSASFTDLTEKGYLPEAIINYIALLGWNPKDDREFFTLSDLKKVFSIKGLQKSPAIFDQTKLDWINSQHLMKLPETDFHEKALEFYPKEFKDRFDLKYLSRILHKRINFFGEISGMTEFFMKLPEYSTDLFVNEKMKSSLDLSKKAVTEMLPVLERLEIWDEGNVKDAMFDLVKKLGLKTGQVLWPIRIALSGLKFTPGGAVEIAVILGKEESVRRLNFALEKLK